MMAMTYLKKFPMMPKTYEETYDYSDDLFEKVSDDVTKIFKEA